MRHLATWPFLNHSVTEAPTNDVAMAAEEPAVQPEASAAAATETAAAIAEAEKATEMWKMSETPTTPNYFSQKYCSTAVMCIASHIQMCIAIAVLLVPLCPEERSILAELLPFLL